MRILIVSDTHRKNDIYLDLVDELAPLDMVIHCGDVEGSEYVLESAVDCQVHMVTGNNDFFSDLPREQEFMIGKYKVFLTHGHNYYVSMGSEILKEEARSRGADIVMFGHTHRPSVEYCGDIIALNPGSLTYPRQEGRRPSYILMEIDESGEADFTIEYI